MKINLSPNTNLGKWSIGLIASFFLFMILFFLLVASGQRGGETFFSNPLLAIPISIAGLCGIAAFFTGLISSLKNRERAISVFLSIFIGLFVLLWILGEIFSPH